MFYYNNCRNDSKLKIAIGSDHIGFDYKEALKNYILDKKLIVKDYGCFSKERTDYPNIAVQVGKAILNNECNRGILICGTGVGMCIAANKIKNIRAVVCSEPYSAKLSRLHNDTNVLALGARVVGLELAKMIVDIWLAEHFLGERHSKRLELIRQVEITNTF